MYRLRCNRDPAGRTRANPQPGRNLVKVKRDGPMHLVFSPDEVKNGTDLEYSLPAETVDLIELYCRNYRPQLIGEPSEWLFPGQHGKHKAL